MKIELTLPALERLIGGDTEIEVGLRKQIVEEFAKRHLKEVAQDASYLAALEGAKAYVNEIAKDAFGVENLVTSHLWPTVGQRLKSMIESLVRDTAQKAVDAALLEIMKYQKRYWLKEIEEAVKKGFDREIEREIQDGIRKRLDAAAKAESGAV